CGGQKGGCRKNYFLKLRRAFPVLGLQGSTFRGSRGHRNSCRNISRKGNNRHDGDEQQSIDSLRKLGHSATSVLKKYLAANIWVKVFFPEGYWQILWGIWPIVELWNCRGVESSNCRTVELLKR